MERKTYFGFMEIAKKLKKTLNKIFKCYETDCFNIFRQTKRMIYQVKTCMEKSKRNGVFLLQWYKRNKKLTVRRNLKINKTLVLKKSKEIIIMLSIMVSIISCKSHQSYGRQGNNCSDTSKEFVMEMANKKKDQLFMN